MKTIKFFLPSLFLMFLFGVSAQEKGRLIVMADMGHDPDEEQQMTHLLLCTNELDLEGLIAVTGRYFRDNPRDSIKWLMPELFEHLIDGYEAVHPNLLLHDGAYPSPKYLRSIVASGQEGNGIGDVGKGKTSEGSRLITKAVLKDDPRPLYIVANSGSNTLAQALFDYRESHTPKEMADFIAKIRVYDNGGQDSSGAWICREFPNIHWIRSNNQTRAYGGPTNEDLGPHTWKPYPYSTEGQHQWVKEHVQTNHGALGKRYPNRILRGDYFFVEGGGTIPWMCLVRPGLSDISQTTWGGWSGRFSANKTENVLSGFPIVHANEQQYIPFSLYSENLEVYDTWKDDDGKIHNNEFAAVFRWRQDMWNDLQTRADWCVKPYEQANHHPHAVINNDTTSQILKVVKNYDETIELDASGSYDPDGDELEYNWWVYPEAGRKPYGKPIKITNANKPKASLKIPFEARTRELHIILEVRDNNNIVPLVDYRRMVVVVTNY